MRDTVPVKFSSGKTFGGEVEITETHPSFACLRLGRSSGQFVLFDSPVRHGSAITLSIHRVERIRHLHETRIYPREELIEITMSEQQFAQAITSGGMHSGMPCTLTRFARELVPGLPDVDATRKPYDNELKGKVKEVQNKFTEAKNEMQRLVDQGRASKKELIEAMKLLTSCEMQVTSGLPFLLDQFSEYMTKVEAKVKNEISTYADNWMRDHGLQDLKGKLTGAFQFALGRDPETTDEDRK